MKNLLNRSLTTFTFYSLVVLAASVPAYYYLVDSIWLKELDEHNMIIADRTVNQLKALELTPAKEQESVQLLNLIEPGLSIKRLTRKKIATDSFYTVRRINKFRTDQEVDRFRGLSRSFILNNHHYRLYVETNVEETEETALAIAILTFFFFVILVIGFLVLNRRLSKSLWAPFRDTLGRLKAFKLSHPDRISFIKTNIIEFEELHTVLSKLIDGNIATYKVQKEFTENASHELQTPLAVIKNKLDLLLQQDSLTERQYQLIEAIDAALSKTSRLSKNLLLLARIENRQFEDEASIAVDTLLRQSMAELEGYREDKGITISTSIIVNKQELANRSLTEILITNLLVNAIRYSPKNSEIHIALSEDALQIRNPGSVSLDPNKLFKRFATSSSQAAGSGLGLALVHQICVMHKWTVHYSFGDAGHTFEVRF